MNDAEQIRLLNEISELLRQNLQASQTEAASAAEFRALAIAMQESNERSAQAAAAEQRSAMRWHTGILAATIVVGFVVMTLELKLSMSELGTQQEVVTDGHDMPDDIVRQLFPPEQNEPPQAPPVDSI